MFEKASAYLHRIVVLTAPSIVDSLTQALTSESIQTQMKIARVELLVSVDSETITSLAIPNRSTLVMIGASRILSAGEIKIFANRCFNLHAAPPSLPGRDPHHWAVYLGLTEYGATLHKIEPRVDSGEIYAVETFPITDSDTPTKLLAKANEVGIQIITSNILEFAKERPFSLNDNSQAWGERKFKREDLIAITRMNIGLPVEEIQSRVKAFFHPQFSNLILTVGDYELVIGEVNKITN